MQITRSSLDTTKGPEDWFTGDVYIDAVAAPAGTSTFAAATVHFTPGRAHGLAYPSARPDHLRHRTCRAVPSEGGGVEVIRPGDRVFFEPGENHWHGATASRFMVHTAIQQTDESGSPASWGRHVTDGEYAQAPSLEGA